MATTTTDINEVSRLSAASYQKGDFYSENDVRIDGHYVGTISTKGRLVVGENAVINGEIVCENLDIWGKIEGGNAFVRDTLSLKASSIVHADMSFKKVQIEVGAEFVGACTKLPDEEYDKKLKSSAPEPEKKVVEPAQQPVKK